jgi:hypothetical protein
MCGGIFEHEKYFCPEIWEKIKISNKPNFAYNYANTPKHKLSLMLEPMQA